MRARSLPLHTIVGAAVALSAIGSAPGLSGCAHQAPLAPEGPSRAIVSEAGRIGKIAYEDDFTEARLVFQALPAGAAQRGALRSKLLHYLLDPVLALNLATLK